MARPKRRLTCSRGRSRAASAPRQVVRNRSSAPTANGSSIAAQVDHLRYGFADEPMEPGENPFESYWMASWRKDPRLRSTVEAAPRDLATEAHAGSSPQETAAELDQSELNTVAAAFAHSPITWRLFARSIFRARHQPTISDDRTSSQPAAIRAHVVPGIESPHQASSGCGVRV